MRSAWLLYRHAPELLKELRKIGASSRNEARLLKVLQKHCIVVQKWGKIAEIMGDRTAFQCAMIYNDQKYEDWFRPTMASYGRNKRRLTGNSKKYLSSHAASPAVPIRPDLADKTAKGAYVPLHAALILKCPLGKASAIWLATATSAA